MDRVARLLLTWLSVYALLFGIMLIAVALRLRKAQLSGMTA